MKNIEINIIRIALADKTKEKANRWDAINTFLVIDSVLEIRSAEKVTSIIEAAYLGSVEKNKDLLSIKSPIVTFIEEAHLSKNPNPKGETKSHDTGLFQVSPSNTTSNSFIFPPYKDRRRICWTIITMLTIPPARPMILKI